MGKIMQLSAWFNKKLHCLSAAEKKLQSWQLQLEATVSTVAATLLALNLALRQSTLVLKVQQSISTRVGQIFVICL